MNFLIEESKKSDKAAEESNKLFKFRVRMIQAILGNIKQPVTDDLIFRALENIKKSGGPGTIEEVD